MSRLHRVLASIVFCLSACGVAAAQQPQLDQLRLIAPAAPGGGWDQTARVMQQVLQRTGIVRTAPVENIPGAAGTIGLARFVGSEQGRDDAILVSGLIMLGGIVMHRSPVTLHEVTPIARLTGEYEAIVVPANSPFRTLADMIRALKERPEATVVGRRIGRRQRPDSRRPRRRRRGRVSGAHQLRRVFRWRRIAVRDPGRTGLARHQRPRRARAADTRRARCGLSPSRAQNACLVSTCRRCANRVSISNSRTGARVVAPPGIGARERQRLESVIAAMVVTPEWREALARYRWIDRYLTGERVLSVRRWRRDASAYDAAAA